MKEAESYDLDGVIISGTIPFQFDTIRKYFRADPINYLPPAIFPVDREVEESYFMPANDVMNYVIQSVRSVDIDTWQYLWDRNVDMYGNTGRPNKRPWVDLTRRTLDRGLVLPRFKDIFFRPKGVIGIQSKGAALLELLERYDKVTHFDDDPWVIFGLAKIFPNVDQGLTSGILMSQEEKTLFPNVTRVGQLRYSEPKYSPVDQNTLPETIIYQSHFESKIFHYGNIHR
jgi:hypothetical protein